MTDAETELQRLEATRAEILSGQAVEEIRDGAHGVKFQKAPSLADLDRRIGSLRAEIAGRPARPRARRFVF